MAVDSLNSSKRFFFFLLLLSFFSQHALIYSPGPVPQTSSKNIKVYTYAVTKKNLSSNPLLRFCNRLKSSSEMTKVLL